MKSKISKNKGRGMPRRTFNKFLLGSVAALLGGSTVAVYHFFLKIHFTIGQEMILLCKSNGFWKRCKITASMTFLVMLLSVHRKMQIFRFELPSSIK